MAVPLILGSRVLGVIEIVNALSEDDFDQTDLMLLQFIAHLASFVFGCAEDALDQSPPLLPDDAED